MALPVALSLSENRPPLSRAATALVALAVHVALLAYWQRARTVPPAPTASSTFAVQWIRLPPPQPPLAPVAPAAPAAPLAPGAPSASGRGAAPARPVAQPRQVRRSAPAAGVDALPAQGAATAPAATPASELDIPAAAAPAADGQAIMERARRSAAGVDRALRRENHPVITAPLDSPQMRMRQGLEEAQALAQPNTWEAPKVEQLVNGTADGARRTRVITGRGTYCITERSPVTSIDMIEKHGRLRITNCPQHESTAKRQRWRTARD